jgi:hypothetical protein
MKNKRSGGAGSKRGMGSAAGRTWQMYALFDDAGRLLDTGMGSKFTVRRIDLATAWPTESAPPVSFPMRSAAGSGMEADMKPRATRPATSSTPPIPAASRRKIITTCSGA